MLFAGKCLPIVSVKRMKLLAIAFSAIVIFLASFWYYRRARASDNRARLMCILVMSLACQSVLVSYLGVAGFVRVSKLLDAGYSGTGGLFYQEGGRSLSREKMADPGGSPVRPDMVPTSDWLS